MKRWQNKNQTKFLQNRLQDSILFDKNDNNNNNEITNNDNENDNNNNNDIRKKRTKGKKQVHKE